MNPKKMCAAFAIRNTMIPVGSYLLLRALHVAASDSAVIAMVITQIAYLIAAWREKPTQHERLARHPRATRMLTMATAVVASCIAAASADCEPIYFLFGIVLGIVNVVYAFSEDIDDYIAPIFLVAIMSAQAALIILVLG
jgi:hypothetical protein